MSHLISVVKAGSTKKGDVLMLSDRPCKVMQVQKSAPGKHGSAKVRITALDVFTSKKVVDNFPGHVALQAAETRRKQFELSYLDVEAKRASLLSNDGEELVEMELQDSLLDELTPLYNQAATADKSVEVTVMTAPVVSSGEAVEHQQIVAFKMKN